MKGITKERDVSIQIRDDGENVIVTIRHGYHPNKYLTISEETKITLARDKKVSLLTHFIDVAFEKRKWIS